jgi:lysozyme family protein
MTTTQAALSTVYNEVYAAAARDNAIPLPTAHALADLAVEMMAARAFNQNYALVMKAVPCDYDTIAFAIDAANLITAR